VQQVQGQVLAGAGRLKAGARGLKPVQQQQHMLSSAHSCRSSRCSSAWRISLGGRVPGLLLTMAV
jgi:hypothetical protein